MSFWQRLSRLWAWRGRRDLALEEARAALERGAHEEALRHALRSRGPDAWRLASRAARALGRLELAVRLDRAADDPADTGRVAELAGALARAGELDGAIAALEEALAMSPFDAVLRSELAILLARAARPAESVATLALHPCLAEDPGALFQFAWSSLLAGDCRAARECVPQLARHREAAALTRALESALARADAATPAQHLRDWLFVEHGALLLDGGGPRDAADSDAVATRLAPLAARVLVALDDRPPRVIAADEASRAGAGLLASELGVELAAAPRAGIPEGLVVASDARALEPLAAHVADRTAVRTLAWVMTIEDAAAVPDLVGVIAGRVDSDRSRSAEDRIADESIVPFARARCALLPPRAPRDVRAFVPDAPIDWSRARAGVSQK